MLVIGHRGAMDLAPENTLRSVRLAIELGADAVEVDVHLVDGHLVVIHDDTLDRTTNGTGPLADASFEEIRALDAGDGERVPTLDEVLDEVAGRAGVNVELKGPGTAEPVVRALARRGSEWADRVVVSSFDRTMLEEVHARSPDTWIGALLRSATEDPVNVARAIGAYALHPPFPRVDEALVRDAHRAGLHVFPFTVDEPEEVERLRSLGVDGVFTNRPDRVARAGERVGRFPGRWGAR